MNCKITTQKLDELLDGQLSDSEVYEIQSHMSDCAVCRQMVRRAENLQASLRDLPASGLRPDFARFALNKAKQHHERQQKRRLTMGGAIAAGFVLLLMTNLLLTNPEGTINPTPVITLAVDQTRDIRLVFSSKESLDKATFTVQLPNNMELKGYPNQRMVSWQSKLRDGKNLLVLPVIAYGSVEDDLIAVIEHAEKKKTFRLSIEMEGIHKSKSSYPAIDMA